MAWQTATYTTRPISIRPSASASNSRALRSGMMLLEQLTDAAGGPGQVGVRVPNQHVLFGQPDARGFHAAIDIRSHFRRHMGAHPCLDLRQRNVFPIGLWNILRDHQRRQRGERFEQSVAVADKCLPRYALM